MDQEDAAKAKLRDELATLRRPRPVLDPLAAQENQADEEFTQFFAQSLDLLGIAGFDGYFKRLNAAWTTCLGWTLDELKARPFLDLVHPDDREAARAGVAALAADEGTALFENRCRHRDGSYRWLRWSVHPVPGRGRIYAIGRDVSQQIGLENEIIEIADREKERMGRELHDGLCQTLAGIAALSATLARTLAAHADPATSAAVEIAKLLNETIRQARDLARGLAPLDLHEAGLNGALDTLAFNVEHLFHVSCTLACEYPVVRPRPDAEAHLFRIAQEAVNNSVIHGRADRIEICLSSRDGKGLLSVRDNGAGLSEKSIRGEGIGLHTMAYRARLIGGSLDVRQRTQRGTAVICVFPLAEIPAGREAPDHVRDDA